MHLIVVIIAELHLIQREDVWSFPWVLHKTFHHHFVHVVVHIPKLNQLISIVKNIEYQ